MALHGVSVMSNDDGLHVLLEMYSEAMQCHQINPPLLPLNQPA